MIAQKQPNGASCLPTAFAAILEIPVRDIFDYLKHDGMEVLWPDLPPPICYRSFHIQEMYTYMLSQNYAVTTLAPMFGQAPTDTDVKIYDCPHFHDYITYYVCVFTGTTDRENLHAVAWDGIKMMDPATGRFGTIDFTISNLHIVSRVR